MFNNRDVYRADNSFYQSFAMEQRRVTVKSLLSSILDQLVQLNRNIVNNNNIIINVSQMAQLADRRREALNSYSLQWDDPFPATRPTTEKTKSIARSGGFV